MTWGRKIVLTVAVLSLLGQAAMGDLLITRNGRRFQGKIIEANDIRVVFEIHQYGATVLKTFQRHEIKSLVKGELKKEPVKPANGGKDPDKKVIPPEPKAPPIVKYNKPTYYLIPLEGVIGMHITGAYLKRCLTDAEARKVDVVILVMDSPGGFISEVDSLVNVIHSANKTQRIVIFVRSAISAAAITALACKEIYFTPQAIFGAATAYQKDAFGLPSAIAEKFQSVWRARARSAAAIGGHNPLLAEAMIDNQMELHIAKDSKGKVTIRNGSGGTKTITTKGKLLTLTAVEAKEVGLAKAIVVDYDQLGMEMQFKEWVECKGHAALLGKHRRTALSEVLSKMDDLKADFNRNYERAWMSRPETPSIPYRYDTRSGMWLAESRRRWASRSRECSGYLMQAEANIKELRVLTESFEEIKENAKMLKRIEDDVREARLEIVKDQNKRGPDD